VAPAEDEVLSTGVLSTEYDVLRQAPELLRQNPDDASLFVRLAQAAGDLDLDQAESWYLLAARDLAPDDPDTQVRLARALTRQGRFEEAVGPWFAVLALRPDAEAQQAVDDLRRAQETVNAPWRSDHGRTDGSQLVEMARAARAEGFLSAAESYLADALSIAGTDLSIIEEREELRLARSELVLTIARTRAAHDLHSTAQSLVARFEAEYLRVEIEILNLRCERLPRDWIMRLELARRLKRAHNYSGAIQRLEEAARLRDEEPEVLVELGECWQHLRQFDKALAFYQQAISHLEKQGRENPDLCKLIHYRAGVLTAAMGRRDEARGHFAAVVVVDSNYKDARERLDKLRVD
jgi:tetratricopeptide (TPR) repeat protein